MNRLEEMYAEDVRLGCRCWEPPRDPNDIGHLESCPALEARRQAFAVKRGDLQAQRDTAVRLLRTLINPRVSFGDHQEAEDMARAFLEGL